MPELQTGPGGYLFVYGTLRRGAKLPLAEHLSRQAVFLGRGVARGRLFLIGSYPGMVDSDQPTDLVIGDLYQIPPSGALLQQLDEYEECAPNYPEPREYQRRQAQITSERGGKITAWLYYFNRPVEHLTRIESGEFQTAPADNCCLSNTSLLTNRRWRAGRN